MEYVIYESNRTVKQLKYQYTEDLEIGQKDNYQIIYLLDLVQLEPLQNYSTEQKKTLTQET